MITSKVTKNKPEENQAPITFPMMARYIGGSAVKEKKDFIVYFVDEKTGIVIQNNENSLHTIKSHYLTWQKITDTECWEILGNTEVVELRNV